MAYADDGDIVERSVAEAKETYSSLVDGAKQMGLQVNEKKTKVLVSTTSRRMHSLEQNLTIGGHNLEIVRDFVYLGSSINTQNRVTDEIKRRIILANRCYYGLYKHLRNDNLTRTTKISLYKTLILPILTYASETWATSRIDELLLLGFERKVLRAIFGGVCEDGIWRKRYNHELDSLYERTDSKRVVTLIKVGRLRWAGHVARYEDSSARKRTLSDEPVGRRRPERLRLR